MSYPDLGCFAECLTCELCDGLEGEEPDLSLDWDDFDRLFGDDDLGLDDWAPPEEGSGNLFDDLELPDVYPWVKPSDGGWTGGIGGQW